ncbi:MAG: glutamate-cysteine ligase family protein [Polyangiaceae bacterium]
MTEFSDRSPGLHLFEGFGIELEYMIVDRANLAVRPICDRLFEAAAGHAEVEVERGEISWSNELALHVVELKTSRPVASLSGLANKFQEEIGAMQGFLAPLGARLMPTAMHPWMDPLKETKLWPHEQNDIYRAFDRLFGCKGHGWSNLQSMHINLPFQGDDEFGRLHAAIRVVLPLLPALAASSPVVEAKLTGIADNRLEFYRRNASSIRSVTGRVIPEPVFDEAAYRERILGVIARDLAAQNADEVLEPEWVNARGAIARFVRDSIEIRVLDLQECPAQDLAVASLVTELVRAMVEERWSSYAEQKSWEAPALEEIFLSCAERGSEAYLDHAEYLELFGLQSPAMTARRVWGRLAETLSPPSEVAAGVELLVGQGSLAERIVARLHGNATRAALGDVYLELCECLREGRAFR